MSIYKFKFYLCLSQHLFLLSELKDLQKLNISNNDIKKLPSSFSKLTQLRSLDIENTVNIKR
ncbi:leucine-rich repeat domain-containing protein [Sulfurimonas sp.]|uniref:leucine-rich repeat domain-containing protein n=1 Tax=Sulfurimonas sp. TaxID=2022749 RepID=UPI00341D4CE7